MRSRHKCLSALLPMFTCSKQHILAERCMCGPHRQVLDNPRSIISLWRGERQVSRRSKAYKETFRTANPRNYSGGFHYYCNSIKGHTETCTLFRCWRWFCQMTSSIREQPAAWNCCARELCRGREMCPLYPSKGNQVRFPLWCLAGGRVVGHYCFSG